MCSTRLTGLPAVVLSVPSRLAGRALPKAPAAMTVDRTPVVPLTCRVSLAPAAAGVAVRLRASNAVPLTTAPAGQQGVTQSAAAWMESHGDGAVARLKP